MSTQKITIEPVTRIEGHAKITIHLNEDGGVDKAYLHINEFRGFEKFCEGRSYLEMPSITPRICGICPVSHHLAAAKAGDALAGSPPPRPASLLRELMHMGQIIQSHGMHFYELAGPDLLLGFDQDPATRNVVGLIAAGGKKHALWVVEWKGRQVAPGAQFPCQGQLIQHFFSEGEQVQIARTRIESDSAQVGAARQVQIDPGDLRAG